MEQQIIHTQRWAITLAEELLKMEADRIVVLTDCNVARQDWLRRGLCELGKILPIRIDSIEIGAGEEYKNLETLVSLWKRFSESGLTRRSIVVNIGGGVVSDIGGFAAATFKRGVRFVNVPTTLLAMADAAIGGKTGIDFNGLKNEVGAFAPARKVIIDTSTLSTLPEQELRSGFAEVVKMTIVTGCRDLYNRLVEPDALHNEAILAAGVRYASDEKEKIVREDPFDSKGVRALLNFGHTAGHAYESYAAEIGHPISHGEGVAHGMLAALRLSHERNGLPIEDVEEYEEKILRRYYQPLPFGKEAAERLEELMGHDKKNKNAGEINWILIDRI